MQPLISILRISILSAIVVLSQIAFAATYTGRVVGISDGDTITVLDSSNTQHKVRLAGIDAPEKSQAFGQRSKEHLSDLVFGKAVTIDTQKNDKYGREIGKVIVSGQDANLAQVRMGLAWHYKAYEKEQSPSDRTAYAQAEAEAHNRHVGLWQDPKPVPPWDFRHGTGDASLVKHAHAGETCPCGTGVTCTGPKGGIYCLTPSGRKNYK